MLCVAMSNEVLQLPNHLADSGFACRRNELVALDLVVTAVSTMFAFVAMIGEES